MEEIKKAEPVDTSVDYATTANKNGCFDCTCQGCVHD